MKKELNNLLKEFILKACESIWKRVDIVIEKEMMSILSKFTVLVSLF